MALGTALTIKRHVLATGLPLYTQLNNIADALATIETLVNELRSLHNTSANGMRTSAGLGIGSSKSDVANILCTAVIDGTMQHLPANTSGTVPGNTVVPQGLFGAVALDLGADGTVDATPATGNATGYASAALAAAGLPAVAAAHVRLGYVTASRSNGTFTFGTTLLDAANTTVAYTNATPVAVAASSTPAINLATVAKLATVASEDFELTY